MTWLIITKIFFQTKIRFIKLYLDWFCIATTPSNTKREGKMRYKYVYFFKISKPNFDENKLWLIYWKKILNRALFQLELNWSYLIERQTWYQIKAKSLTSILVGVKRQNGKISKTSIPLLIYSCIMYGSVLYVKVLDKGFQVKEHYFNRTKIAKSRWWKVKCRHKS